MKLKKHNSSDSVTLYLQSEKSKKAGKIPPTTSMIDFLKTSYGGCSDVILLEEDVNYNLRASSLSVSFVCNLLSTIN